MDQELEKFIASEDAETAARLAATVAALKAIPAEEIPRPIRFVSDKVLRHAWWRRLPVWGVASAAMLAGAIVSHGWLSRLPLPAAPLLAPSPAVVDPELAARLEADIAARLTAQYERKLEAALRAARTEYEERLEFERRAILASVEENFSLLRKQLNRMYVASAALDGPAAEVSK